MKPLLLATSPATYDPVVLSAHFTERDMPFESTKQFEITPSFDAAKSPALNVETFVLKLCHRMFDTTELLHF